MSVRRIAERFSRGVVLRRKLPAAFGAARIYVSPDAYLRLWRFDLGKVDPLLFSVVHRLVKPGTVVWDVGANVGLFAFAASGISGKAGRVFAIEPDYWLVNLMRRSARELPATHAPVDVLPVAISDQVDLAIFNVASRGRAANFLDGGGSTQTGGTRYQETVMAVTLDWLGERLPSPNVLKIDVEKLEHKVLNSGMNLLRRVRPAIFCEVSDENADEVTRILKSLDYNLFAGTPESLEPAERAPWNTVALPK
jgi:FkbM family methyltransferase